MWIRQGELQTFVYLRLCYHYFSCCNWWNRVTNLFSFIMILLHWFVFCCYNSGRVLFGITAAVSSLVWQEPCHAWYDMSRVRFDARRAVSCFPRLSYTVITRCCPLQVCTPSSGTRKVLSSTSISPRIRDSMQPSRSLGSSMSKWWVRVRFQNLDPFSNLHNREW